MINGRRLNTLRSDKASQHAVNMLQRERTISEVRGGRRDGLRAFSGATLSTNARSLCY